MGLDLFEPVVYIVKRKFLGAVKNQNDAHSSFVVGLSNRAEAFLAGSVPNLKLDSLVVDWDSLNFKIDA